jgi:hypothetical protein
MSDAELVANESALANDETEAMASGSRSEGPLPIVCVALFSETYRSA